MPFLRIRPAAVGLAAFILPATGTAAPMPVQVERFEGEVVQVAGSTHSGVVADRDVESGTEFRTGADGRVELRLHGVTTLAVGNRTELLLHSMDQRVLRMRMAGGALRIDTRGAARAPARDVRLNVGDLRLRVANAEAFAELSDRGAQVCLIAGRVEAQQPSATARLDTPGQCLRQSGHSAQWSMVPVDVLQTRVAQLRVPPRAVVTAPPLPPPPPPPPPLVVIDESTLAAAARPPVVASAPAPAPEELPVAPAAATTLAVRPPAALESLLVPPPPEPLPQAPAPPAGVAIATPQPIEPIPVPPVPEPPPSATTPSPPVAEPAPAPPPAEPLDADELAWRRELIAELMVREGRVPPPAPPPGAPAPAPDPAPAAAETADEVALAAPATRAAAPGDDGRRWRVVLGSMPELEKAELEVERLAARGWAVEAREYRVGERHGFRIGFGEFDTRDQAQAALDEFLKQYPDAVAWLAKY